MIKAFQRELIKEASVNPTHLYVNGQKTDWIAYMDSIGYDGKHTYFFRQYFLRKEFRTLSLDDSRQNRGLVKYSEDGSRLDFLGDLEMAKFLRLIS